MPGTDLASAAVNTAGKSAASTLVGKLVKPRPTDALEVLRNSNRSHNRLAHSINNAQSGERRIKLSKKAKDGLHIITQHFHDAFGSLMDLHEFASLQLNINEVDRSRGGCYAFFFGEAINSYTLALPPKKDGEIFYSPDDAQTTTDLREVLSDIETQKTLHYDWALAALLYLRLNEQIEQLARLHTERKEELYGALKVFVSACEEHLENKNLESYSRKRAETVVILGKLKAEKNHREKGESKAARLSQITPILKNRWGTLQPSLEAIAWTFIKGERPSRKEAHPSLDIILSEKSTLNYQFAPWPDSYTPSSWMAWNVTSTKEDHYGKIIKLRNLIKKTVKRFYKYIESSKGTQQSYEAQLNQSKRLEKLVSTVTDMEKLGQELCALAREKKINAYNSSAILAHSTGQLLLRGRIMDMKETKAKIKQDDIPALNLFFFKSILELCYLELIYTCSNAMEYLVLDSQLSSRNQHVNDFRRFLHNYHEGLTTFISELDTVGTEQIVSYLHKSRDKGIVRNKTLERARADAQLTLKGTVEKRRELDNGTSICVGEATPGIKELLGNMDEVLRGTDRIRSQGSIGAKIFELALLVLFAFDHAVCPPEPGSENTALSALKQLSTEFKINLEQSKQSDMVSSSQNLTVQKNSRSSSASNSTLESDRLINTSNSSDSSEFYMGHLFELSQSVVKSHEQYNSIDAGGFLGLGGIDIAAKWGRHGQRTKEIMAAIKKELIDMIGEAMKARDKHSAINHIHDVIKAKIIKHAPTEPPYERRSIGYFLQQNLQALLDSYEQKTSLSNENLEQHTRNEDREGKYQDEDEAQGYSKLSSHNSAAGEKTAEIDIINNEQHHARTGRSGSQSRNWRSSLWSKKTTKNRKANKKKKAGPSRRSTQEEHKLHQTASFRPMSGNWHDNSNRGLTVRQ